MNQDGMGLMRWSRGIKYHKKQSLTAGGVE